MIAKDAYDGHVWRDFNRRLGFFKLSFCGVAGLQAIDLLVVRVEVEEFAGQRVDRHRNCLRVGVVGAEGFGGGFGRRELLEGTFTANVEVACVVEREQAEVAFAQQAHIDVLRAPAVCVVFVVARAFGREAHHPVFAYFVADVGEVDLAAFIDGDATVDGGKAVQFRGAFVEAFATVWASVAEACDQFRAVGTEDFDQVVCPHAWPIDHIDIAGALIDGDGVGSRELADFFAGGGSGRFLRCADIPVVRPTAFEAACLVGTRFNRVPAPDFLDLAFGVVAGNAIRRRNVDAACFDAASAGVVDGDAGGTFELRPVAFLPEEADLFVVGLGRPGERQGGKRRQGRDREAQVCPGGGAHQAAPWLPWPEPIVILVLCPPACRV